MGLVRWTVVIRTVHIKKHSGSFHPGGGSVQRVESLRIADAKFDAAVKPHRSLTTPVPISQREFISL